MMHSLRFLLPVPALLALGLRPAQGQCSRSSAHCGAKAPKIAEAAPRPALLRLAVGPSLSSSGDFPVLKTQLEYAPQFSRHLRLGSRVAYTGGAEQKRYGDGFSVPRSYRAVSAEQEFYWLPFGTGRRGEFGMGGGVFVSYFKAADVVSITETYGAAGGPSFSYVPRKEYGIRAGYIASLYADLALNQKASWLLGGRLALQSGIRTNVAPGGQLQISRAL